MPQNFRLWLTNYPLRTGLVKCLCVLQNHCLFLLLARSLRGFSSDIYFGNMVNFLKISHAMLCCPPPQPHNCPGIFKSQSCRKWASSRSSIIVQIFYASTAFQFVLKKNPCSTNQHLLLVAYLLSYFEGGDLACALPSLIDPRRIVDFQSFQPIFNLCCLFTCCYKVRQPGSLHAK